MQRKQRNKIARNVCKLTRDIKTCFTVIISFVHLSWIVNEVEKKRGLAVESFLTYFEVFGYLMKTLFQVLIKLLKLIIIYRENEGKNMPKSMQVNVGFQTTITLTIFFVQTWWIISEFEFSNLEIPEVIITHNWSLISTVHVIGAF